MKFYHKTYIYLDFSTTRVIYRFLFWPKTIDHCTRWLEFAYIRQIAPCGVIGAEGLWDDYEWVYNLNSIKESETKLNDR